MKSGVVTYWVEIPVDVSYSAHPEEKQTENYTDPQVC